MTIPSRLAARFPRQIRQRGADYQRSGMVDLFEVSAARIDAHVAGSAVYDVSIERDANGDFSLACSCPYAEGDVHCKHVWATLLEADSTVGWPQMHGKGAVSSGTRTPRDDDAEDDFEDDELDDAHTTFGTAPRVGPASPSSRQGSWKSSLRALHGYFAHAEPHHVPARWPENRRIAYVVDARPGSATSVVLAIDVATQARNRDGTWGRPKQMRQSRAQWLAVPDPDDRLIAQMLLGTRPDYGYALSINARFQIPADLAQTTLRRMCLTGRCRVRYVPGQTDPPLLSWYDGEPLELRLSVDGDTDGQRFSLQAALVGESLRIDVRHCALIVGGGVALHGDTALPFRDHGALPIVQALRTHLAVDVPRDEALDLVGELLAIPVLPPLELPDELRIEHVRPRPLPRLSLAPAMHSAWQGPKASAILSFDYAGRVVAPGQKEQALFQPETRQLVHRNLAAEAAAGERLAAAGFRREYDYGTGRHELRIPASKIDRVVHELVREGWFVEHGGRALRAAGAFAAHVTSGIDWFDLEATVDFGPVQAALPDLLAALARGDRTIALDDGSLGIIGGDWTSHAGLLAALGTARDGRIRFGAAQAPLLDVLLDALPAVHADERFSAARAAVHSFNGIAPRDPPPGFSGTLRPYQRDGLGWLEYLATFGFGGCLADDMGLGKTIQALALLEARRALEAGPSLVVVPLSLVFNWQQEAAHFAPSLRVLVHSGTERRVDAEHLRAHDLVLTTYGTLRRDAPALAKIEFDYVILDEAQAIKNPVTASAKAARLLRARHRLAMTGTPIENRLRDLWSLLDFLNPGMLGTARVFQRLTKGVSDADEPSAESNGTGETRSLIARAVRPFLLRRTKDQVARDLPEKLEQTIYVDLSEKERKLYDELRDHYRASLLSRVKREGMGKSRMHVLEALLRLRQAASHPGLIDKSRSKESSSKLDLLLSSVAEAVAEHHKVLVFSQFTSLLAIVRRQLESEQLLYEYLDGHTRDRARRVKRFQTDPACRIFLISLKAGGLGLNLTAADYVFLLDPWWNPAVEAQAIDRAHRIGQERRVFASRLISRGTVEEKVLQLQERKRELADAIIQAEEGPLAGLKREELELLLT